MVVIGRKWCATVAALCAISLPVAACTKDGDDAGLSKRDNQRNTATAKALPGVDVTSASRSELRDGGSLTIPISNYPTNFNQFTLYGNDVATALVLSPTAPLFYNFTEIGRPVRNPDYLTSAKVVDQSPFTVEFDINPRAVWSDGTPIGYADLRGEWLALRGKVKAFEPASTNGFETITSVRHGSDDRHVLVTFSRPYSAWPELFNGLVPRSVTATPATFNNSWKNKPLLSGGPFLVSHVDSTAKVVTLSRNPRWWGAAPKLNQIVMRTLDLNAVSGAFKNGEVDIVDASKDPSILKAAKQVKGAKILRASSVAWHLININARSPMLKDPKMRRAIAMGIPRDIIAKQRQEPFGAPPIVMDNHILAVTQEGYQDNATAAIGPDAKKAGQLLDALGWKREGKWRTKNGATLTLHDYIPAATSSQSDVAQIMQNALGQIGVKLDIIPLPIDDFIKHVNTGAYDVSYLGWTGGPFPECDMKSIFYPAISQQNKTGASSQKVGSLFDQACSTLDPQERTRLANEIDKELFRINSMLPLFNDPAIAATKSGLANLKIFSSAFEQTVWQDVGWMN